MLRRGDSLSPIDNFLVRKADVVHEANAGPLYVAAVGQ